jgi:HAD superfamily hydrolase (TIGR01549 family)
MTLTLLLDLDNTLLGNEMGDFLPVYLKKLSQRFPQWPAEEFIQKLMAATQVMVRKNQPRFTLEESFDQVFYPSLGIDKNAIIENLNAFYEEEFPKLQYTTRQRPEAVHLVDQAFSAGYQVVIATNPIFPLSAIRHRLAWAGLPIDRYPFHLVTSFERLHFSKPNSAYYAEICAQLGYPEHPIVMVGDNMEDDLIPSARIGIPGFLINGNSNSIPSGLPANIQSGRLENVWNWIQSIVDQDPTSVSTTSRASIQAILKSTPAAFDSLCRDLTPEQWNHRPAEKEWTITEILCHLRDVDNEVNLPRLEKIAQEDTPFLAGISTDPWAEERDYFHQSGKQALSTFIENRTQMTTLLDQLSPEGWQRPARHAIFGPSTLEELVSFITTHDIVHIRQGFQTIQTAKLK